MGNHSAALIYTQYSGMNTIKIAIYKNSDPETQVDAKFFPGPFTNHIFLFEGLDAVAYQAKRYEVENDNHAHVLADYGVFYVFTPAATRTEFKMPVRWTAGLDVMPDGTPYPSGVNSFTNADWAGWEATIVHQFSNILERGREYSYDSITGTLTKLQDDDVFEPADYEIHFAPRINDVPDSGNSDVFTGKRYITAASDALTPSDAGKKIIVRGTANYVQISLPKLSEVQELKLFYIEMPPSDAVRCARFFTLQGEKIDFGKGNKTAVFCYPSESFAMYKETNDLDPNNVVSYWRIQDAPQSFFTVGETVFDEGNAENVINLVAKDGGGLGGLDASVYARLYEWFVANLDASQVVPFNQWATGTNRYKYSLIDGTTHKFRIPDTTGQFIRQSSGARHSNTYEEQSMIDHKHVTNTGELPPADNPNGSAPYTINVGQYNAVRAHKPDLTGMPFIFHSPNVWAQQNPSTETRPANVANNGYLRI
jgi:hypothetical protein